MAKKFLNAKNILKSLDFVLNDLLEQVKNLGVEGKDASYVKLVELFFKGLDLRGKVCSNNSDETVPQLDNVIKNLDTNNI